MSVRSNHPNFEEYRMELVKVWKNDTKMIDYCIGQTQSLVKLSGGQLFTTDKPTLKKEFCYGYSSCGQGPTYEECNETIATVRKHLGEVFKDENLEDYDRILDWYNGVDTHNKRPYLSSHYWPKYGANIVTVTWIDEYDRDWPKVASGEVVPLSEQDRQTIIGIYKSDREAMVKRCEEYLKKYGTEKLHVWRYWIDE